MGRIRCVAARRLAQRGARSWLENAQRCPRLRVMRPRLAPVPGHFRGLSGAPNEPRRAAPQPRVSAACAARHAAAMRRRARPHRSGRAGPGGTVQPSGALVWLHSSAPAAALAHRFGSPRVAASRPLGGSAPRHLPGCVQLLCRPAFVPLRGLKIAVRVTTSLRKPYYQAGAAKRRFKG